MFSRACHSFPLEYTMVDLKKFLKFTGKQHKETSAIKQSCPYRHHYFTFYFEKEPAAYYNK